MAAFFFSSKRDIRSRRPVVYSSEIMEVSSSRATTYWTANFCSRTTLKEEKLDREKRMQKELEEKRRWALIYYDCH